MNVYNLEVVQSSDFGSPHTYSGPRTNAFTLLAQVSVYTHPPTPVLSRLGSAYGIGGTEVYFFVLLLGGQIPNFTVFRQFLQ